MRDATDHHDQPIELGDVEDAVIADAGSPHVIGSADLHGAGTRICGEAVDPPSNPALDRAIQLREGTRGGRQDSTVDDRRGRFAPPSADIALAASSR